MCFKSVLYHFFLDFFKTLSSYFVTLYMEYMEYEGLGKEINEKDKESSWNFDRNPFVLLACFGELSHKIQQRLFD